MIIRKTFIVAAAMAFAVGLSVWLLPFGEPSDDGRSKRPAVVSADRVKKERGSSGVRRKRERRVRENVPHVADPQEREKPEINVDEDELAKLDELERQILKSLRDAIDCNDLEFVRKTISLMKQKAAGSVTSSASGGKPKHWSAYVHGSLKQAAVDALGWFGPEAIEDLIDFVADTDADIAQSAIDKFELAMQDATLADYERAAIIKTVSQVFTDADTLDWMFMEAINARNSVGVDTLAFIAENGTDKAREMLPEYIDMFTGEEYISTISDLKAWLETHQDQPDDEEFYGHMPAD